MNFLTALIEMFLNDIIHPMQFAHDLITAPNLSHLLLADIACIAACVTILLVTSRD